MHAVDTSLPATALSAELSSVTWYHTIELPGGLRTPGFYDTIEVARRFPFPASLEGKRCLDVGTANGFWAFEMERRGASEVVAIDIDDPGRYDWPQPPPAQPTRPANTEFGVNAGFEIAHRALGSSVRRLDLNVYDLPDADLGSFDFVFMGALMLHLRDPIGAIQAIREVTAGDFMSADVISLQSSILHPLSPNAVLKGIGEPRWWTPNIRAYLRMIHAAGFEVTDHGNVFFMPFGEGFPPASPLAKVGLGSLPRELFWRATLRRLGAPASWALARPRF